ncbi:MAG TPA: hypothetical protein VM582_07635 [Candidatus Thermoplasmatota archaeon]|nr:hypothetical protein [Candidatus Thermoplasmatota archaeon]
MAWPAWLVDLWTKAKPYADRAAVWRGYEQDLTSLTILTIGIALYTVLVFAFYQGLSRRDPFHSGLWRGHWYGHALRSLESTFVFPTVSFLYFSVLAATLFFLAHDYTTYRIFLLSMAVVAGVRLTAFVTEGAAADLGKLLPLSLLGVMIVNPSYASWESIWGRYLEIPSLLPVLGRFFLLFLVFETGLRLLRGTLNAVRGGLARRRGRKGVPASRSVAVEGPRSVAVDVAEGAPEAPGAKAR